MNIVAGVLLGLLLLVICVPTAYGQDARDAALVQVEVGDGVLSINEGSASGVRTGAHVRPISQLGPDAFRLSYFPGIRVATAYVFELRKTDNGATFDVVWLDIGARASWVPTRHASFHISEQQFNDLTSLVDSELDRARGFAARIANGERSNWICVDGPDLLTERIHGDHSSWMSSDDCDTGDPNGAIEQRLRAFALDQLGR